MQYGFLWIYDLHFRLQVQAPLPRKGQGTLEKTLEHRPFEGQSFAVSGILRGWSRSLSAPAISMQDLWPGGFVAVCVATGPNDDAVELVQHVVKTCAPVALEVNTITQHLLDLTLMSA